MGGCSDSLDKVVVYEWLVIESYYRMYFLINIHNVSVEGLVGCVFSVVLELWELPSWLLQIRL